MKLKNIILGVCILTAFSACSKDDGPDVTKDGGAYLSVRIASKTSTTKADDPHELPGEANINNLAVLVFSEDGSSLLGSEYKTLTGVTHEYTYASEEAIVPGYTTENPHKAMIVLVANAPGAIASVNSYSEFETVLAQLSAQSQDNLTMSTQVIKMTDYLRVGGNYIGVEGVDNINDINEPLWLTRLPARLEVTAVSTKFTRPVLLGRTVTINSIYFDNVKTQSRYFSEADWGIVQVDDSRAYSAVIRPTDVIIDNDNPRDDIYYINYVMENLGLENTTGILVNATLSATDEYSSETVLFRADINQNGIRGTLQGIDITHQFIKRNFVYRITMAFGDNAFIGTLTEDPEEPEEPEEPEDPDPPTPPRNYAELTLQVEVVGWGEVNQEPIFD